MKTSHEEYEEVESPFAPKSADKLRSRKNVFNRPFTAETTIAPTYYEPQRKSIGQHSNVDLIEHRESDLLSTEIDYLDEVDEESEEEVLPVKRIKKDVKKSPKTKSKVLVKIGWVVVGLLTLRLVCMDRGVWDYFATESEIRAKKDELSLVRKENKEIQAEVIKIQNDMYTQRQLAKEHLGVIAADEFLILFAGETPTDTGSENVSL